jgi:hypothetical protein
MHGRRGARKGVLAASGRREMGEAVRPAIAGLLLLGSSCDSLADDQMTAHTLRLTGDHVQAGAEPPGPAKPTRARLLL